MDKDTLNLVLKANWYELNTRICRAKRKAHKTRFITI